MCAQVVNSGKGNTGGGLSPSPSCPSFGVFSSLNIHLLYCRQTLSVKQQDAEYPGLLTIEIDIEKKYHKPINTALVMRFLTMYRCAIRSSWLLIS